MKNLIFLCLFIALSSIVFSQEEESLNKAMNLLKERKFAESISEFNKYIDKHQDVPSVVYNRGLAFMFMNDFDQAIRDFDKSILLDSTFPDAYNNRGLSLSYQDKIFAAMADFNKAIKLDRKFGEAYINRASVYIALKKNDSAMMDLNSAIKYIPKNPELFSQRARLHYLNKDFKKSIDDYSKAISLGMKNSKTYYNRANAYFKLNNFEKAVDDYTVAINLDPKDKDALNNRAFAFDNLKKPDLAKNDRMQFDALNKSNFPPIESLTFRSFSDSKGNVSIDLPNEWILNEIKNGNDTEVLISPQKTDANSEGMSVGVTIGIVRNLSSKYKVSSEDDIVDFWKGSTDKSNEGIYKYEVRTEKHMQISGHKSSLILVEMQASQATIPFKMYEYVIAWGDNLIYIYYQAPMVQFDYWQDIFEKSIKSLRIQENLK